MRALYVCHYFEDLGLRRRGFEDMERIDMIWRLQNLLAVVNGGVQD